MGEIERVVLRLLEAFRRHVGQAEKPGRRSFPIGDVEGVEQVQALDVVVEQRVRPVSLVRALGERVRAPVAEQQHRPGIDRHVFAYQAVQRPPEIRFVQMLDQLAGRAVPGHVLERWRHACTPWG
ncbi:hypothetical protein D9M71_643530 [compost metagenome]